MAVAVVTRAVCAMRMVTLTTMATVASDGLSLDGGLAMPVAMPVAVPVAMAVAMPVAMPVAMRMACTCCCFIVSRHSNKSRGIHLFRV